MASLGVGKIEDIFAEKGLTGSNHASGNPACIDAWMDYMKQDFDGLCFTNLVDTDSAFGHRRDPEGFAGALAYIDSRIPEIKSLMGDDDLLIITADHGCDPAYTATTDHTREYVPLLIAGKKVKPVNLGTRTSFADIAATITELLGVEYQTPGKSFAKEII